MAEKLSFFLLLKAELSELGISKKLSFLAKIAPEFFKNLSFLGDLSFPSVEKKSLTKDLALRKVFDIFTAAAGAVYEHPSCFCFLLLLLLLLQYDLQGRYRKVAS